MAQSTNRGGGDHRSKQAKVDIARREEQIVALRLRGISFAVIGRTVGISKQAAPFRRRFTEIPTKPFRSTIAANSPSSRWNRADCGRPSTRKKTIGKRSSRVWPPSTASISDGRDCWGWTRRRSSISGACIVRVATRCRRCGWRAKRHTKACRWKTRPSSLSFTSG